MNIPGAADVCEQCEKVFVGLSGSTKWCPYCGAKHEGNSVPLPQGSLAIPADCPHLIVFDDTDRQQLMFAGNGAREAALNTWERVSMSWNAHLFVRVERNSRDDLYPSARTTDS